MCDQGECHASSNLQAQLKASSTARQDNGQSREASQPQETQRTEKDTDKKTRQDSTSLNSPTFPVAHDHDDDDDGDDDDDNDNDNDNDNGEVM